MKNRKQKAGAPSISTTFYGLAELAGGAYGAGKISRNQFTYGSIKRMILSGQLGPGNKLVHEDLAETLEVSRTPVREALERLHQEGFVTRLPRRGFYVAVITTEEARDLYGAREALETYALSETMGHGPIAPESLALLSSYVDKYDKLLDRNVLKERLAVDVAFHLKLAELSGNHYLVSLLAQSIERITLKRRLEGYRSDRGSRAAGEHRELMDALVRHDKEAALTLLRSHIQRARDTLLVHLREVTES